MSLSGWNSYKKLELVIDKSKVESDLVYFPVTVFLDSEQSDIFKELSYGVIEDDFTGADGDPLNTDLWILRQSPSANSDIKILNNSARLILVAADSGDLNVKTKFNFVGNFDIQLNFNCVDDITTAAWWTGLQFRAADSSGYWGHVAPGFDVGNGKHYKFRYNGAGGNSDDVSSRSSSSGSVRLTRNGSNVSAYYWGGSSWVQIGSTHNWSSADMYANLYGYKSFTSAQVRSDFDNFTVNSGTVVWPQGTHPNRKKIAFVQSDDETPLFCEIEHYDESNKKAIYHVSAPNWTIASGFDNKFYMYYDASHVNNNTLTISEASDDFIGNNGDPPNKNLWYIVTDGVFDCKLVNNNLSFETTESGTGYTFVSSFVSFHGDFNVEIDVNSVVFEEIDMSTCGLRFVANKAAAFVFTMFRRYSSAHGHYIGSNVYDGSWGTEAIFISTVTTFKLRVVRSGSSLTFYRDTGDGWIQHDSRSSIYTGDVYLEITCGQANNNALLSAKVNNIIVNSADTVYSFVEDTGFAPAQRVWGKNFKAVYHLSQYPTGGTDCIKDSTANANHGTPYGSMTSDDLVDGLVGKGLNFDGSDDYIDCGTDSSINISDKITVETAVKGTSGFIVGKYNQGVSGWILDSYIGGRDGSGSWRSSGSSPLALDNSNRYVVGIVNTNLWELWVDGTKESYTDTSYSSTNISSSVPLKIGILNDGTNPFAGTASEIRISNIVRNSVWLNVTNYSIRNQLLDYYLYKGYFSGYVYERSDPVSRKLYLHARQDGSLLRTTTSSGNGYYYMETTFSGAHYIVCLDDPAGADYNDLIIGPVFPTRLSS